MFTVWCGRVLILELLLPLEVKLKGKLKIKFKLRQFRSLKKTIKNTNINL